MAETAETVIKDALSFINAIREEEPLAAADAQLAIRVLNRMMAAYTAEGLDLLYTPVDSLASLITTPAVLIEGMVHILGLKLYPHFHKTPPDALVLGLAAKGYQNFVHYAISVDDVIFAATVPRGSGNTAPEENVSPFYPGEDI